MITDQNNQQPLTADTQLEYFKILKYLARGAFGITYMALDTKRNRPVVIKEYFPSVSAFRSGSVSQVSLLSGEHSNDYQEGLRRFKREAMTLNEFKHPNIVEVIAYFEANNTAYFVMEYVEGESLADKLKAKNGKPFSEEEINRDFLPILKGLKQIHSIDLLHLDIKPDNILQTKFGEPLLIDFGGARFATGQASHDHSSMVATTGYAPPEQYSLSQEQTPASDIYAFGMTLYQLMTGCKQGDLPDSKDRQNALLEDIPDPLRSIREAAPGFSEVLYTIVKASTQIRKSARPESITAVNVIMLGSKTKPEATHESEMVEDTSSCSLIHSERLNENQSNLAQQKNYIPDSSTLQKELREGIRKRKEAEELKRQQKLASEQEVIFTQMLGERTAEEKAATDDARKKVSISKKQWVLGITACLLVIIALFAISYIESQSKEKERIILEAQKIAEQQEKKLKASKAAEAKRKAMTLAEAKRKAMERAEFEAKNFIHAEKELIKGPRSPLLIDSSTKRNYVFKDGLVIDIDNNLMWMRCEFGQTWNGVYCEGKAERLKFDEAQSTAKRTNYGGYSNWRVPTIQEINSLVYCENGIRIQYLQNGFWSKKTEEDNSYCKIDYVFDLRGVRDLLDLLDKNFINIWGEYWSSSPHSQYSESAWAVSFFEGNDVVKNRHEFVEVRLVRSGQ